MNTMKENISLLGSSRMKRFLQRVKRIESKSKKLKFGFELYLSQNDQKTAKIVNSIYESLVWGQHDNADQDRISKDEKRILAQYLKNSCFAKKVLEVGVGSGRVSALFV